MDELFDVVIVGAGTAGCALAGRLSEVRNKRVLLIEAGPDAPPGREHPDVRDPFPVSMNNPRFSWPNLMAEIGVDPGTGRARALRPYIQGWGVGGGSNINGMIAFRGFPEEYDEWRDQGAVGWGWKDVLPHFRKLEHDLDFSGPLHGDSGPIPIRRISPTHWGPFSKTFGAVLARRGYPLIEDCNADFRDGVVAVPMSNFEDERVSASRAYLTDAVRRRPNLTISSDTLVERLIVRNGRTCGVAARIGGQAREFSGRETLVACGGLYSPALLLRSGIGPGFQIQAHGLRVVRDLPGVGQNLQNRPKVEIIFHLPRRAVQPSHQRGLGQGCLRYSSGTEGCATHDMGIKVINQTAWHPLGRRIAALGIGLYKPYSKGSVELNSVDPTASPRVRFNALSDSRDFERLVQGLRFALQLLQEPQLARLRHEAFLPDPKIVARLSHRNAWNWLQARVINLALESSALRRALLKHSTVDIDALVRDESALRDFVHQHSALGWHVCGTCKMGSADDVQAVVDPDCRVRGLEGLRVIDASVFPTVVGEGGMQLSVLMVAEKMADRIKAQWGVSEAAA